MRIPVQVPSLVAPTCLAFRAGFPMYDAIRPAGKKRDSPSCGQYPDCRWCPSEGTTGAVCCRGNSGCQPPDLVGGNYQCDPGRSC